MQTQYDIIIIGGGVVGLSCALACAQAENLRIAIIDQKTVATTFNPAQYDARVFAINNASKAFFTELGVFNAMQQQRINPYEAMYVWDDFGEIYFDCQAIAKVALGYIIENQVLLTALLARVKAAANIELFDAVKLSHLDKEQKQLTDEAGHNYQAKLIIGADGANSWLRDQLQFTVTQWPYYHHALVTTVTTEKAHDLTARQRFTAHGPLAFLPLDDPQQCSIVWSTPQAFNQRLQTMDDAHFCQQLTTAFDRKLGDVQACTQRFSFPLTMRHTQPYSIESFALIGDALHTIHPLAGQGLNLGLQDARCLTKIINKRHQQHKDIAGLKGLRAYARERKCHNLRMIALMEGFKQTFTQDAQIIKFMRGYSLSIANQLPLLKNKMIEFALG